MNPIETDSVKAAGRVFDEVIVPMAERRKSAAPYFPLGPDRSESYFSKAAAGRVSAGDFEFPGGGAPGGLLEALTAHWQAEGETALAAAQPLLADVVEALKREVEDDDGSVDIFCYTLF